MHNLGKNLTNDRYVHHTERVPVLKKTALEGKDFHSSLEFLHLKLSNRYK